MTFCAEIQQAQRLKLVYLLIRALILCFNTLLCGFDAGMWKKGRVRCEQVMNGVGKEGKVEG